MRAQLMSPMLPTVCLSTAVCNLLAEVSRDGTIHCALAHRVVIHDERTESTSTSPSRKPKSTKIQQTETVREAVSTNRIVAWSAYQTSAIQSSFRVIIGLANGERINSWIREVSPAWKPWVYSPISSVIVYGELEANLPQKSQDGAALLADERQRKEPPTPSGKSIIAGVAEPSNMQATGNVRSDVEGVLSQENIVIAHQDAREETGEPEKPGSLIDLIRRNRPTVGLPTKQSLGLPESLLWHTLISLLKAMLYLHAGRQDHKDPTAHKDWMPVVHNLINPETISYGDPPSERGPRAHGGTRRPAYGVCKLGDFSQCVVLQSRHNPIDEREVADRKEAFQHLHSGAEQTGYEAPELQVVDDELPGPASDLWSIGAVMVSMMTGGKSVWDLVREIKFADHAQKNRNTGRLLEGWTLVPAIQLRKFLQSIDGMGDIVMALPGWYSFDLRILIEGLLASNPLDRGEAIDVLEDAVSKFETRAGEGDYEGPSEAEEMTSILAKSRRAFREAEAYLART
ncbi:hypothetical protein LTR37_008622 [Vermiconidia calcicola]|uniref:Uncharacterized protein n=1 Tax=Vermiconidia calcicola TaxID=1690605 RepID=A0ACC3N9Z1_9PEZI|nr:hypothetical protein LTR37_008622 [Vermiconidia calcicola]